MDISSLFGRLTLDSFKHGAIEMGATVMMVLMASYALFFLTYKKKWKWFYDEWLTSLDPKKIGVMYLFVVLLMLLKGAIDAMMLRAQQALSCGDSMGYLGSDHFQQLFTAHGTVMIFFVGMGIVFGMINLVVPLQIGARDVAFPFLNAVSFWLFFMGFMLLNVSLMPLFTWAAFATMTLVIFAFPILTVTITLLALDRLLDMHFFTSDCGGNPMMYVNLIWAWGHPEVYILILPAFGIFSEVVSTFSEKRLFGYVSMVWAIAVITILSFIVWLHHFFTMGASANVNAFFGAMTMLIAIPTGVKIFNWLFTMVRGRVHLTSPMLWFLGFVIIFTVGGMAGILLSIAPVDFQTHNSLFLIAHFHSVIIGGVVFGFFSGFTYWFPKFTGFKLNERLGKCAFWCWFVGFFFAFLPLYVLGLMGTTRRLSHYDASTGWQPFFIVAAFGAALIATGIGFQVAQGIVSIKQRKQNLDLTGDPWNGRTLEWDTSSPPPLYNFAVIPEVHERDAFWVMKETGHTKPDPKDFTDVMMPKNTPMGLIIGVFAFLFSFGIIWYIWWMVILGIAGVVVSAIIHLSEEECEYVIPKAEIARLEKRPLA